ncbi:MAG: SpoIIE family protein phosphatase [Verrucomicrobia bacterium]|nr:SpoIIE family protein phosphatase [Verrucomicrobiota bacterium]
MTPSTPAATEDQGPSLVNPLTQHTIRVLLVDDQAIIGEAVRRMLAQDKDINFHYCSDPTQAVKMATELSPTVILQDLVMPEVDGLTLVKFYRANPKTRDIPLIVLSTKEEPATKAEAFGLGANDYLVKLPDKVELLARIRYHSAGYIAQLQRNEAYRALVESQKKLAAELAEAAAYVRSLLPAPITGEQKAEWRFIPSTELGGDALGYHWFDDDHLVMYVLDVCGHGVGAALLSISAMNVIRSHTLPNTNFLEPGEVLTALNDSFQMEKHNNMYFTIWYGVYDKKRRRLSYASGGHPPAVLITGQDAASARPVFLETGGTIIGAIEGTDFKSASCDVQPYAKMYLFSDGAYEIFRPDGSMWEYEEFVQLLQSPVPSGVSDLDHILSSIGTIRGTNTFDDDFSLVQVCL